MALHTDLDIYKATLDLSKLITQLVSNMPKNYRADFGADLRRRCMGLVMRTYEVNTVEPEGRPAILKRMRHDVEAVNLALRLSVDLDRLISPKQYGRAIALTESISKQATGWQKHTESRLSPARQGGRANAHR